MVIYSLRLEAIQEIRPREVATVHLKYAGVGGMCEHERSSGVGRSHVLLARVAVVLGLECS